MYEAIVYLPPPVSTYILFNFSKKYPDFSKYFIEELTKASCGICSESLNREQIVLTNPCGHILCVTCSTQLCKVWKENGTTRKRCPICRTLMLGHLFAKPALFNCSRLNSTSLFIWVPTSVYVRQNYPQSLLECLNERNFKKAFYYTFLLNSVPTKLEESLAPGWGITIRAEGIICLAQYVAYPSDSKWPL